jgi:hypothetical protein
MENQYLIVWISKGKVHYKKNGVNYHRPLCKFQQIVIKSIKNLARTETLNQKPPDMKTNVFGFLGYYNKN